MNGFLHSCDKIGVTELLNSYNLKYSMLVFEKSVKVLENETLRNLEDLIKF